MKNIISFPKRVFVLFAVLMLAVTCLLTSCTELFSATVDQEKREEIEPLVEDFLDALIDDDVNAAYKVVKNEGVTLSSFKEVYPDMQACVDGAESYEMKLTGKYLSTTNGTTVYMLRYQVTTDNGKVCNIEATVADGYNGLAGVYMVDIDELLQLEKNMQGFDIALMIYSVAVIGLSIWMLIDCCKRTMRRKWLWILLILLGGVTVSFVQNVMGATFTFGWGLIPGLSGVNANTNNNTLVTSIAIPVGMIIYMCMRKKLTRQELQRRAMMGMAGMPPQYPPQFDQNGMPIPPQYPPQFDQNGAPVPPQTEQGSSQSDLAAPTASSEGTEQTQQNDASAEDTKE